MLTEKLSSGSQIAITEAIKNASELQSPLNSAAIVNSVYIINENINSAKNISQEEKNVTTSLDKIKTDINNNKFVQGDNSTIIKEKKENVSKYRNYIDDEIGNIDRLKIKNIRKIYLKINKIAPLIEELRRQEQELENL